MKKYLVCFLAMGLLLVNCSTDDDGLDPGNQPDPDPDSQVNVVVQNFMWRAMNFWYFWQESVPNLADDAFSTDEEYTEFLASETDPAAFFTDDLTFSEDRFSFLSSDFRELTQRLAGNTNNNGVEFGLSAFSNSDDVYGVVRYILPNSDASTKDISRGEIFTGVNGTTLNRSNFSELLFGEANTYTLNMASLENNVITPNGKEVELTKQRLSENPVFIDEIYEVQGTTIGYLMYNSFTNEYDEQLNEAFGRFVDGGVTELVLDLRYNGGGSVNSARLLSSMIHGTNTSNLFLRQRWNAKLQSQFSQSQLEDFFASSFVVGDEGEERTLQINTLNLNKVYVLALNTSASASELVINGLEPYMDVVQIGLTTTGKNEFSITMVDDVDSNFGPYVYNSDRESNINPENSWAIQPLVGRNENADGFFDYTDGLAPDIEIPETLENFGVLGALDERLLARAISEITGTTGKYDFTAKMPVEAFEDSKRMSPMKNRAILDKPMVISFE